MATMVEGNVRLRRTLRDEDGQSFHGIGVYAVSSVASSGQASTIAALRLAMFTALRADSALNTALRANTPGDTTSKRVFHDQAPAGTPLNYINLGDGSEAEGDTSSYDLIGTDSEIVYDIWGIVTTGISPSPPPVGRYGVEVIQAHVARVLHAKQLVLT